MYNQRVIDELFLNAINDALQRILCSLAEDELDSRDLSHLTRSIYLLQQTQSNLQGETVNSLKRLVNKGILPLDLLKQLSEILENHQAEFDESVEKVFKQRTLELN